MILDPAVRQALEIVLTMACEAPYSKDATQAAKEKEALETLEQLLPRRRRKQAA
jgi:hypothetical protein